jgi:hypothetical protein
MSRAWGVEDLESRHQSTAAGAFAAHEEQLEGFAQKPVLPSREDDDDGGSRRDWTNEAMSLM